MKTISNLAKIFDEFAVDLKLKFLRKKVSKLALKVKVVVCLKVLRSLKSPKGSHLTSSSHNSLLLDVEGHLRDARSSQTLTTRKAVAHDRS